MEDLEDTNKISLQKECKHIPPSRRKYYIRNQAYLYSLENPDHSEINNWLHAEQLINAKYPN